MRRRTNIFVRMVRVCGAPACALYGNLLRWSPSKRTNANAQLSELERTEYDEKFLTFIGLMC